jgi:hypothetical protein
MGGSAPCHSPFAREMLLGVGKDAPGELFAGKLEQKASAAAEVMLCREPLLGRRSLVRRQFPACSPAVENLDSPQHYDGGRYQRGRRQYTF